MQVYKDADISLDVLNSKVVAVLGYGNQGRPQALNLKDSGIEVVVGLRESSYKWDAVKADGFNAVQIEEAVNQADIVMMLLPDEAMEPVYENHVKSQLKANAYLGFCHGMAIHAGLVQPKSDINVFLMAPKAQGLGVRQKYLYKTGVPGLIAVHQDVSGDTLKIALAYGKAIGCGRVGMIPTTFAEEMISNHFCEQAVLCGGLSKLIQKAFEVQIEAGISPAVAYFGCLHEVRLLAELIYDNGITGMREKISKTALYGDLTRGGRIIDDHVKENMRRVLADDSSETFVKEFLGDVKHGQPLLRERFYRESAHPIEETRKQLKQHGII